MSAHTTARVDEALYRAAQAVAGELDYGSLPERLQDGYVQHIADLLTDAVENVTSVDDYLRGWDEDDAMTHGSER